MATGAIYRGMSQAELDAAYNNRAAVPDSAAMLDDWARRSAALYAGTPCRRDLAYGPGPRQRLDWFPAAAPGRPTFVFVHGGYWQWNDKEGQAFVAAGPLALGLNVALIEYTLAPAARMGAIVGEIATAVDWLAPRLGELGADPRGLIVAGSSAGGHLAATVLGRPTVRAGLCLSGLYDLEPIRLSYLNHTVGMDAATAQRHSPLHHLPQRAGPVVLAVGGDELPELRRQSRDYAAAWQQRGLPARFTELAGANHFSILDQLANPRGNLAAALANLAAAAFA